MKKIYSLFIVVAVAISANAQVYTNAFKIESANTDKGVRITTDNAGMVITTGSFSGIADFDPSGTTANLTPSGSSTADVYIAKYDAALNYQWAINFPSSSGSDYPYALTTDLSNNIIVGGDVSVNSRNGFVNKYDPSGNLIWTISIGGSNKDVVYGVKTDAANSVYVTGYFESTVDFDPGVSTYTLTSSGGRDIFLAKYDSNGKFKWAFKAGGTMSTAYEEGGQDIAIKDGNIYLTGNFEGTSDFNPSATSNTLTSNGSLDIFVAKYDTAGNYVWALNVGSVSKHDYSYGIDIDASENVYITGGFEESVDFDPSASTATLVSASVSAQDIFVAKYNSSGVYQWAFQAGGNTVVDDHAFDIDVTPTGDIYITGEFWGPCDFDPSTATATIITSNDQIFFARYTSSGSFVWAFEVGSTSGNGPADNGYGVHVASNGTLYVTGDFSGTADFDPSFGTANLIVPNQGHAFIASYGTAVFSGINSIELDGTAIKAFPNPSNGQVNFSYSNFNNSAWSLEITEVTGKVVLKAEDIKQETINLNTAALKPGVYFYTIKTENKVLTKKLILQ